MMTLHPQARVVLDRRGGAALDDGRAAVVEAGAALRAAFGTL
jgi:hypothetical protein